MLQTARSPQAAAVAGFLGLSARQDAELQQLRKVQRQQEREDLIRKHHEESRSAALGTMLSLVGFDFTADDAEDCELAEEPSVKRQKMTSSDVDMESEVEDDFLA